MALVTAAVFFTPLALTFWPLALSSFATCFLLFLTIKQDGDEGKIFLYALFSLIIASVLWLVKFLFILFFFSNGL